MSDVETGAEGLIGIRLCKGTFRDECSGRSSASRSLPMIRTWSSWPRTALRVADCIETLERSNMRRGVTEACGCQLLEVVTGRVRPGVAARQGWRRASLVDLAGERDHSARWTVCRWSERAAGTGATVELYKKERRSVSTSMPRTNAWVPPCPQRDQNSNNVMPVGEMETKARCVKPRTAKCRAQGSKRSGLQIEVEGCSIRRRAAIRILSSSGWTLRTPNTRIPQHAFISLPTQAGCG